MSCIEERAVIPYTGHCAEVACNRGLTPHLPLPFPRPQTPGRSLISTTFFVPGEIGNESAESEEAGIHGRAVQRDQLLRRARSVSLVI